MPAVQSKPARPSVLQRGLENTLWSTLFVINSPLRVLLELYAWGVVSARGLVKALLGVLGWLNGRVATPVQLRRWIPWKTLKRFHFAIAGYAICTVLYKIVRAIAWRCSPAAAKRRALVEELELAETYEEWDSIMCELEEAAFIPCPLPSPHLYDRRLLEERTRYLAMLRREGDLQACAMAIRSDLVRNLGNVANAELHETSRFVPDPIRRYSEEVGRAVQAVALATELPLEERLSFLRETRHAFGRTALVLSGGGSFGAFHLGVARSLLDAGLLPRVLAGSSAGSIVCAIIGTRTERELRELFASVHELGEVEFFGSNTLGSLARHLLRKGTLQDHRVLQERLRRLLGDLTFADAYQRSGRVLNVVVTAADTAEPARLLNYLTAPQVLVWSAVACSSAFPLLFEPQPLLARWIDGSVVEFTSATAAWGPGGSRAELSSVATPSGGTESRRRWRDGSLEADLPMAGLGEMFSVNYFLVAQCNPYLLPILALKRAAPHTLGRLAETEFKHRCRQALDLLPLGMRRGALARLLRLFNQPWEGDCTMVLPFQTLSAAKSVVNLSREDLLRALREGQRATWAKLPAIAVNCAVEATIDECLRAAVPRGREQGRGGAQKGTQSATSIRRRLSRTSLTRMHRRASLDPFRGLGASRQRFPRTLPSWLHMPSLGMAATDSETSFGSVSAPGTPRAHSVPAPKVTTPGEGAAGGDDGGEALGAEPRRAVGVPERSAHSANGPTDHGSPRGRASEPIAIASRGGSGKSETLAMALGSLPESQGMDDGLPDEVVPFEMDEECSEEEGFPAFERQGSRVWTDLFLSSVPTNTALDFVAP